MSNYTPVMFVFLLKVNEIGAASRDGRLSIGMRILEVRFQPSEHQCVEHSRNAIWLLSEVY